MTTAPKAHHIVTGMNDDGEYLTLESFGLDSLLTAGEIAMENSEDLCRGARVHRLNGYTFEDVTEQAAALVFEKWLEDAADDEFPGEWLTENCPAAADEHERRRLLDPGTCADWAYDEWRAW